MFPNNAFDFADDATWQVWITGLLAEVLTLLGWILLALAVLGLAAYLLGIFKLCRAASRERASQPNKRKAPPLVRIASPKPRVKLVASSKRKTL